MFLTDLLFASPRLTCGSWRRKSQLYSSGQRIYAPRMYRPQDSSAKITTTCRKSKQWNKHCAIYMSNANMPREMLGKEFCVRFITASLHASPMELMRAMKESISWVTDLRLNYHQHPMMYSLFHDSKSAESGIRAWDCKHNELEVLLCPYHGLIFAGDNPMQAEECNHGGLKCNYFCRTCNVGGTREFKESDQGFESLFKVGAFLALSVSCEANNDASLAAWVPRNPDNTARQTQEQLWLSTLPNGTEKAKNATASTGVKGSSTLGIVNCLLELGKWLWKPGPGKKMSEEEIHATLEMQLEEELLKNP